MAVRFPVISFAVVILIYIILFVIGWRIRSVIMASAKSGTDEEKQQASEAAKKATVVMGIIGSIVGVSLIIWRVASGIIIRGDNADTDYGPSVSAVRRNIKKYKKELKAMEHQQQALINKINKPTPTTKAKQKKRFKTKKSKQEPELAPDDTVMTDHTAEIEIIKQNIKDKQEEINECQKYLEEILENRSVTEGIRFAFNQEPGGKLW